MVLKAGDLAPNFEVQTSENSIFKLSDYQGKKVVLYFYPKDDTPGCTTEACDFRENLNLFNQLNCQVIGISRDTIESHVKFKDKYKLNFSLGSDVDGAVCKLYGTWAEKSMFGRKYFGVLRNTFLIDEQGIIIKIWEKIKVSNHIKEILDILKA